MRKNRLIIFHLLLLCIAGVFSCCLACGDRDKPAAHSHTYKITVVNPTCTEDGYTQYACICGDSFTDTIVPALGHKPNAAVKQNEVAATCTTDGGYDDVVFCGACNERLSVEHKTVAKLGHSYKNYVCSVCGNVEHYNVDDMTFTLSQDGNSYIVSGFNGNPTYANIPNEYNGKPVTAIGERAFYKCGSLESVYIPIGIKTIENDAFFDCDKLTSLVIPDGMTTIGEYAFAGCLALTSVTVPKSVTVIKDYAFSTCIKLASVYYAGNLSDFCKITDVGNLMNNRTSKRLYINGQEIIDLVIPDDVTNLCDFAFYGCGYIKTVTIGKNVTTIGMHAFAENSSLTTVYWNATACVDGWFSEPQNGTTTAWLISPLFGSCDNFTTVVIGENVQTISAHAFSGYKTLTSVTIPDGVTTIERGAFNGCRGLTSINIPDSVTTIGARAFADCTGLKSITISKGIKNIGNSAFEDCDSLETVYWNATACVGGWSDDKINPIFYKCEKLTNAVIGDNVRSVPEYLFYHCEYLKSVTVGKNVETMDRGVFGHCYALETVYWNATDCDSGWIVGTSLYTVPFSNCNSFTTLVIGDGVEALPDYMCNKCASLETVVIPASLTYIGRNAFKDCANLTAAYYLCGDGDIFNATFGNDTLMLALYRYSEEEPDDGGQYWHYDENGNMVVW